MLFTRKLFEPQPSLTDGRTRAQKRDPASPAKVYFAEADSFCQAAVHSGSTGPSKGKNLLLKLILACIKCPVLVPSSCPD